MARSIKKPATKRELETKIQQDCRLALSAAGCLMWRNNTGALKNEVGVPVRFGLEVGSSDLIGMTPTGQFLAIETKRIGEKATKPQRLWIAAVIKQGGRAGVARSPQDALNIAFGD
jgi:hypothetical protein